MHKASGVRVVINYDAVVVINYDAVIIYDAVVGGEVGVGVEVNFDAVVVVRGQKPEKFPDCVRP